MANQTELVSMYPEFKRRESGHKGDKSLKEMINFAPFISRSGHKKWASMLSEEGLLALHYDTLELLEKVIEKVAPGKRVSDVLSDLQKEEDEESKKKEKKEKEVKKHPIECLDEEDDFDCMLPEDQCHAISRSGNDFYQCRSSHRFGYDYCPVHQNKQLYGEVTGLHLKEDSNTSDEYRKKHCFLIMLYGYHYKFKNTKRKSLLNKIKQQFYDFLYEKSFRDYPMELWLNDRLLYGLVRIIKYYFDLNYSVKLQ